VARDVHVGPASMGAVDALGCMRYRAARCNSAWRWLRECRAGPVPIQTLIFALMHVPTSQFGIILGIGIIFGVSYVHGSLLVPIVAYSIVNLLRIVQAA
jgi:Type II CAAX prenyl endopeptidase Rce1-like